MRSKKKINRKKCQSPTLDIVSRFASYISPQVQKVSDLFSLIGTAIINCNATLSNVKQWLIYQVDTSTGNDLQQIVLSTNPTINYAQLVIQPNTFQPNTYHFIYTLTMTNTDSSIFTGQIDTYLRITPSGLVISSLSLTQPMYGGTIEISRGQNQAISFNPFLFTYDIDGLTVITSLTFKYSCQIIDSNVAQGYPLIPGTSQIIYLADFKTNPSLTPLLTCFGSTGLD